MRQWHEHVSFCGIIHLIFSLFLLLDEFSLAGFGLALKSIDVSIAYAVSISTVIDITSEDSLVWMDCTQMLHFVLHMYFQDMGLRRHSHCLCYGNRFLW